MSTEPGRRRNTVRILIFLAVVLIGVVAAGVAFAGWTTISMTNGSIDTTWGAPSYSESCDAAITDRDDLKNAWVRYDGTNIYFMIETCAGPALSAETMRAVAAIDCNNDGDFTDPYAAGPDGDRLVIFTPGGKVDLYSGTLQGVGAIGDATDSSDAPQTGPSNVKIEWRVPLAYLYEGCRASPSPVGIAWATAKGDGTIIDQSASSVVLYHPMDYGDRAQMLPYAPATCSAPDTYTGLICNGARHGFGPTPEAPLRFGSAPLDADNGNLQSVGSDADDTTGTTPNDEMGIAPDPTNAWDDTTGTLLFSIAGSGVTTVRMSCWVDFNNDGDWTDTGENVLNNATLSASATSRGITLPTSGKTFPGSYAARCRIWPNPAAGTPTPVPAPYGAIEFGEVEDNIWDFDANGVFIPPGGPSTPVPVTVAISHPAASSDVLLSWTHVAPNEDYQVFQSTTNPYFAPPAGTSLGVVAAPTAEFTHLGVYGLPDIDTFYYNVIGRVSSGAVLSGPSNRTGLFEYGLTPGQP